MKPVKPHTKPRTAPRKTLIKEKPVQKYELPERLLMFTEELLKRTEIVEFLGDHHPPQNWKVVFARALTEMLDLQANVIVNARGYEPWATFSINRDSEDTILGELVDVWLSMKANGLHDLPIEIREQLSIDVDLGSEVLSVRAPGLLIEKLKEERRTAERRAQYAILYKEFNGENPLGSKT